MNAELKECNVNFLFDGRQPSVKTVDIVVHSCFDRNKRAVILDLRYVQISHQFLRW